jgi:hypothetical protein
MSDAAHDAGSPDSGEGKSRVSKFVIRKSGKDYGPFHWKTIIELHEFGLLEDFRYLHEGKEIGLVDDLVKHTGVPPTIGLNSILLAPSDSHQKCEKSKMMALVELGYPSGSSISDELADHLIKRLRMSDSELDAEDVDFTANPIPLTTAEIDARKKEEEEEQKRKEAAASANPAEDEELEEAVEEEDEHQEEADEADLAEEDLSRAEVRMPQYEDDDDDDDSAEPMSAGLFEALADGADLPAEEAGVKPAKDEKETAQPTDAEEKVNESPVEVEAKGEAEEPVAEDPSEEKPARAKVKPDSKSRTKSRKTKPQVAAPSKAHSKKKTTKEPVPAQAESKHSNAVLIAAVIVVLLGIGGFWVWKTSSENNGASSDAAAMTEEIGTSPEPEESASSSLPVEGLEAAASELAPAEADESADESADTSSTLEPETITAEVETVEEMVSKAAEETVSEIVETVEEVSAVVEELVSEEAEALEPTEASTDSVTSDEESTIEEAATDASSEDAEPMQTPEAPAAEEATTEEITDGASTMEETAGEMEEAVDTLPAEADEVAPDEGLETVEPTAESNDPASADVARTEYMTEEVSETASVEEENTEAEGVEAPNSDAN